jgi:hypothetical protein
VGAGGTLANLIFGALFWVVARAVRQSASGRYFFWLLMTFNLFEAGGYFRSPVSATSSTGLRSWRDGSPRGHGASP